MCQHRDFPTSILATFAAEERRDKKRLWLGIVSAVVIHALMLTFSLPEFAIAEENHYRVISCSLGPVEFKAPVPRKVVVPEDPTRDDSIPLEDSPLEQLSTTDPHHIACGPPESDSEKVPELVPLHIPNPECTEIARRARLVGMMMLRIEVTRDGRVTSVKALKGMPLGLTQSALGTLETWRFQPWSEEEGGEKTERLVIIQVDNCHLEAELRPAPG